MVNHQNVRFSCIIGPAENWMNEWMNKANVKREKKRKNNNDRPTVVLQNY